MEHPKLLIDGDIIIHQVSQATERALHWGDDIWTTTADMRETRGLFRALVEDIADTLGSTLDSCLFAFTDYTRENWRRSILPSYKAHRPGVHRKPLAYWPLREWISKTYKSACYPSLEADDVLGILAGTFPTGTIVVSEDKDLQQIPGLLYNPNKPELGVVGITEEEADYFHLYQTMTGDAVDGYYGCPGIGPVRAKRALADSMTWETVVSVYESVGLSEEDALTQARVARILRTPEYNPKTQKVLLWTPMSS